MLETLREFGLERLASAGSGDRAARAAPRVVRAAGAGGAPPGSAGPDEAACVGAARPRLRQLSARRTPARCDVGDVESAVRARSLGARVRLPAHALRGDGVGRSRRWRCPAAEQHPRRAGRDRGRRLRGVRARRPRRRDRARPRKPSALPSALGTDSSGLAERALGNAVFYKGDIETGAGVDGPNGRVGPRDGVGRRGWRTRCTCARSRRRASATRSSAPRSPTRAACAAERCGSPTAIAQARVRRRAGAREAPRPKTPTRRSGGRPTLARQVGQPMGRSVRAHRGAAGSTPAEGDPTQALAGLRVGGRHLVPRRRLGEPVALAAARVRHPSPSSARTDRPRCCTASIAAAGAAAALPVRAVRRRAARQARRRAATRPRGRRVRRRGPRRCRDPRRDHRALRAGRDPPPHRRGRLRPAVSAIASRAGGAARERWRRASA